MVVSINLEEWEWDILDADAAAMDMTRQELLHEMFMDEAQRILAGEDMPLPS